MKVKVRTKDDGKKVIVKKKPFGDEDKDPLEDKKKELAKVVCAEKK